MQDIDLLQQSGRSTHFVVLESWTDKAALDGHAARPSARLADALGSSLVAPIDQRVFNSFSLSKGSPGQAAAYVVTHVDIGPAPGGSSQVDPGAMLKQLAESSRKETGNLRFDVWQGDRRNHFTIVEAWRDRRAADAHASAMRAKQYRGQLQPMAGSPLDERIFTSLN